jgi:glucosamine--fructose-6-phosphate aminotransferase (isomerizing)
MCGIIGYVGEKDCVSILLNGLKRLEYRGYDSSGIAILNKEDNKNEISMIKRVGNLEKLERALSDKEIKGSLGIGHTRWATHGKPHRLNAHPHLDCKNEILLVHNGIIENWEPLKNKLISRGHKFISETDTEVLVHLVEDYYAGDLVKAVRKALNKVEGSYAIVVMSKKSPNQLVGARYDSPLVVGLGNDENYLASDIPAILEYTNKFLIIDQGEIANITKDKVEIYDKNEKLVNKSPFETNWDISLAEKEGYEDFMLKEIMEQSIAVRETFRSHVYKYKISLDCTDLPIDVIKNIKKIFIVACGTSLHAGYVAKGVIERFARIPVDVEIASEFRYKDPLIPNSSLVIAISQSGETIDTIAAIREAKRKNAWVLTISNVMESSAVRESDGAMYTFAGPEIGVAASKTHTAQIMICYLLSLYLAKVRGEITYDETAYYLDILKEVPSKIKSILDNHNKMKELADIYYKFPNFIFIGRKYGFPAVMEGALKLKEISYIHAEAYPAGEMKHGPIALVGEDCPVVAIADDSSVYNKILGNISEVKARNAPVIALTTIGNERIKNLVDHVIEVPKIPEEFSAIINVVPLQLFAYEIAKKLGCNVDQPRNLAKTVTVE